MVDVSICLVFVAMILTPFAVDSMRRLGSARVMAAKVRESAVHPSVRRRS
jgi:hypothetical protein